MVCNRFYGYLNQTFTSECGRTWISIAQMPKWKKGEHVLKTKDVSLIFCNCFTIGKLFWFKKWISSMIFVCTVHVFLKSLFLSDISFLPMTFRFCRCSLKRVVETLLVVWSVRCVFYFLEITLNVSWWMRKSNEINTVN